VAINFEAKSPSNNFPAPFTIHGSTREIFCYGTAVGRSECARGGAIFKLTGDLLNIAAAAGFSAGAYKKFIAGQIHAPNKRRFCVNSIILLLFAGYAAASRVLLGGLKIHDEICIRASCVLLALTIEGRDL
jgi:hypothetical protein